MKKEIHEGDPPSDTKGQKRYPRRATKDDEGPRRGWRKLKRDPPKVGQGEKISTKGDRGSVKGTRDESAKGFQGVGIDSKAVREGPRRTLRFPTNARSIIEPFRFLCRSVSACWNPELPPGGLSFKKSCRHAVSGFRGERRSCGWRRWAELALVTTLPYRAA